MNTEPKVCCIAEYLIVPYFSSNSLLIDCFLENSQNIKPAFCKHYNKTQLRYAEVICHRCFSFAFRPLGTSWCEYDEGGLYFCSVFQIVVSLHRALQCFKCLIGYKMNQNLTACSMSADTWYPQTTFMKGPFSPRLSWQDGLRYIFTQILQACCYSSAVWITSACFSFVLAPYVSQPQGFVCWEKRVERRQVKSSQWADCQTKSPCGFNWVYCA